MSATPTPIVAATPFRQLRPDRSSNAAKRDSAPALSIARLAGSWFRSRMFCLMTIPLFLAGCASTIHPEFLSKFLRDGRHNDPAFKNIVVRMVYNDLAKVLLVGRESGRIEIWDAKAAHIVQVINAHEHRANTLSFTPDGQHFFSNSTFEKNTRLWSTRTGELLHTLPETRGPICATNDRNLYLASQGSSFRVFDLEKREFLAGDFSSSGFITSWAFDVVSGNFAIGTASGTIELWRFGMSNGKPAPQHIRTAGPYAVGNWVLGLQFSADGSSLYSVARTGKIDEWDIDSLKKKRALGTPLRHLHSAAFSPDSKLLAIGGTVESFGTGKGNIELIDLLEGTTSTIPSNTNLPVVVFIPPGPSLLSAQSTMMESREVKGKKSTQAGRQ